MREPPAGLAEPDLINALRDGWAIRPRSLDFMPAGFGSYHWRAGNVLVKVDDLGPPAVADKAFDRLRRSLGTAFRLRASGLDFVLAPLPAGDGSIVCRLPSRRYAVAVYPFLDGVSGGFGPHDPVDVTELTGMLAALHACDPGDTPRFHPGDLFLDDVSFAGGPYEEPARELLEQHTDRIRAWLADLDRRTPSPDGWVLTHGEPHPGNLLRSDDGRLWLIDWDTVAVAPPERDLWLLPGPYARYTELTGRPVSADRLAWHELAWKLADIAIFADELSRPHRAGADLAASLRYLTGHLTE